ncbi:hypothetical protein QR97_16695 [Streptomyces sp. PBH53]|uniref:hypothetical protein n=1 Tax=Streptomyces sp. PBH53 TaxID=1577075 RepID=UPI0006565375|nr:hypothetical protein [Streptomyces sp. PBH53]AKN71226.1 hypothetical protein QR97_16695 [Streptomyces sp. PBH53]
MAGQRMTFTLDGRDDLSRVLNSAGDSAARMQQRLDDAASRSSTSLRNLARDADGRLRFASGAIVRAAGDAGDALTTLGDDAERASRRIVDGADDADDSLRQVADSADDAGARVTRSLRDRIGDAADRAKGKLEALSRGASRFAAIASGGLGVPAAVAGVGVLAASLVSAGAATAAFKLAVVPQMEAVTKVTDAYTAAQEAQAEGGEAAAEAQKEYKRQLDSLPPASRAVAKSLIGLKNDHQKWSDSLSKDTMPVFVKGIELARKVLPQLTPLVKTAAGAFGGFLDDLSRKAEGGGLDRFIGRVDRAAKETLPDLLRSGRNVFIGLGGIIDAFLPSEGKLSDGIEDATKKFAEWGQGLKDSEGFEKFMDLADRSGDALGKMATAGANLLIALGPAAGITAGFVGVIADLINKAPPEVLQGIATGMLAIKLATLGINGAMALMNANPVVLAAAAVVGLGVVLALAWKRSERFRDIATRSFTVVGQVMLGQIRVMLLGMRSFSDASLGMIVSIAEAAEGTLGKIPGIGDKVKGLAETARGFRDDTSQYFTDALGKVDSYSEGLNRLPKDIKFKGEISDLDAKIRAAQQRVDSLKQKKKTAVGADKKDLEIQVAVAQARLDSLKQKRAARIAAHDEASGKISWVQRMLNNVNGRVATVTVQAKTAGIMAAKAAIAALGGMPFATGGLVRRFADGGPTGLVRGPGTATSDSIPALLSNGEYVIKAASVRKYGTGLLDAINSGRYQTAAGGAGAAVAAGLAQGMTGSTSAVTLAARSMAAAVVLGIKTELQIASPSKKTRALAQDVGKGFIAGLTGSRDKIKAVAKDLATDIKAAFSGHKESSLLKMVARETKRLDEYASKRDKIAAKIKEAKAYASDLTKTARGQASLSALGMSPEEVTAGGIKGGLAQKLAQIKRFSSYIGTLAKRGLNKNLIRQILDMGPIDGYAYASALAGADKATLAAVNKSQKAIDDETTKLGRKGADILYDSGKNAGKGFLAGLAAQQKDIEKLMVKIAKGMEKAIKKALGIRSPSTVMARLGAFSTQGLARGLVDGLPHVDRALDTVVGRVAATRPAIGRPAVTASGGGQAATINITVNGAIDPYSTARELDKVLSKYRRGRGGANYSFA